MNNYKKLIRNNTADMPWFLRVRLVNKIPY